MNGGASLECRNLWKIYGPNAVEALRAARTSDVAATDAKLRQQRADDADYARHVAAAHHQRLARRPRVHAKVVDLNDATLLASKQCAGHQPLAAIPRHAACDQLGIAGDAQPARL